MCRRLVNETGTYERSHHGMDDATIPPLAGPRPARMTAGSIKRHATLSWMLLDTFRILLALLLAMHGIGHVIWFLAAWTPVRAGVRDGAWVLPGDVTIRSPIGKVLGLLALMVVAIFVFAAAGLLLKQIWWAAWAEMGVFLSFAAVVPWLRQSPGSTAPTAIIADIVLMFVLALDLSVDVTA